MFPEEERGLKINHGLILSFLICRQKEIEFKVLNISMQIQYLFYVF